MHTDFQVHVGITSASWAGIQCIRSLPAACVPGLTCGLGRALAGHLQVRDVVAGKPWRSLCSSLSAESDGWKLDMCNLMLKKQQVLWAPERSWCVPDSRAR